MAIETEQPLIYILTRGGFIDNPQEPNEVFSLGGVDFSFGLATMGAIQFDAGIMLESPFISDVTPTPAVLPINADPPFPPVWPYTWNTGLVWGRENLTQNLRCIRGNDLEFHFRITRNGDDIDITGATLTLTAKWNVKDTVAVFTCSIGDGLTVVDAATGSVDALINKTKTKTGIPLHQVPLFYDVQMEQASGLRSTVLYGVLTISPNVTTVA